MSSSEERRQDRRFDKVFAVYICGAWGTSFGIARNISEGGMFIEMSDPYPLGSQMKITFSPPSGDGELSVVGRVVHLCFLDRTAAGGRRRVLAGMGVRFEQFERQRLEPDFEVASAWMQ